MQFTTTDNGSFTLKNGRLSGFDEASVSVRVLHPVALGDRPTFHFVASGVDVTLAQVVEVTPDTFNNDVDGAVIAWLDSTAAATAADEARAANAEMARKPVWA